MGLGCVWMGDRGHISRPVVGLWYIFSSHAYHDIPPMHACVCLVYISSVHLVEERLHHNKVLGVPLDRDRVRAEETAEE